MTDNDFDIKFVLEHYISPLQMILVDDLLRTQKSAENFCINNAQKIFLQKSEC